MDGKETCRALPQIVCHADHYNYTLGDIETTSPRRDSGDGGDTRVTDGTCEIRITASWSRESSAGIEKQEKEKGFRSLTPAAFDAGPLLVFLVEEVGQRE